jgi:deoxyhypusine synthase
VTWGKYRGVDQDKMVQVWGEYSMLFPLIAACAIDECAPRPLRRTVSQMPEVIRRLEDACR